MASKDWQQKNPKISGYVPQEVFDRFQEFQEERGFSMSKAVTAILCDYFDIKETTSSLPSGITLAQFQALEKRLAELEEKVEHQPIYQNATLVQAKPKRLEPESDIDALPSFLNSEPLKIASEPLEPKTSVLSGKEMAERLSIISSKLSTEKRNKSKEEFIEWSKELDPDGFAWTYRDKQKGKGVEYLQV